MTKMKWYVYLSFILIYFAVGEIKADSVKRAGAEISKTEEQVMLEEKEKLQETPVVEIPLFRKAARKISSEEIEALDLPEDSTAMIMASQLLLTGNTVISTEELLANIPLIYNASSAPLSKADSDSLYDFRTLCDIIDNPGQPREITARTIRGLTQCILNIYKNKGYSGIFVSIPPETLQGNKLRDNVLVIMITEASVSTITASYFTPENERVDKGHLRDDFLLEWTPTKTGEVGKQKELEDYVNLLNENPDRYISAKITKGADPNTLAVNYNIYEANPWHFFMQVDNAGTDDRKYAPRIGLINTNLFGYDDRLTIFHQAPWDGDFFDNYSVYGSYDIPVMGPDLRLRGFAAYSEFDVEGGAGIDFLGHGSMYGGEFRYNVLQHEGWFLDLRSSLSYEESKVSSSIFSAILGSEVHMFLWGLGVDLHRRTDMANTSLSFDWVKNIGGSSQDSFWDSTTFTGARTNADDDFAIYTYRANHSMYLDADKIQRISGSFQWIDPTDRLVPSKMTVFGGMYTVRGYEESGIVADGGLLASVQYEYDLVKHEEAKDEYQADSEEKPLVRKLAPVVFFDYGKAMFEDNVPGETDEDLYSVGPGAIVELGDNFMGSVYYGFPLEKTTTTRSHDGELNFSVMLRW